ncbi:MAG: replicative DNA helicase [Verrucomicrobia bacterium]|nr:MAG: replicative DNA helicase [Verrucomicrobiota bacterium]
MAANGTPGRTDRLPPYSEEAERGVLGSLLLDAVRVLDLCRTGQVLTESFYVPSHQVVFQTLAEMVDHGRPVDMLTVGDFLNRQGQLEKIGGAAFLERIVDATPTAAHAEYYIRLVREKHLLRMMISEAQKAIETCYAAELEPDRILNNTEQAFYDIANAQHRELAKWEDLVKDGMQKLDQLINGEGEMGLGSGFTDLDKLTHGLQKSELIILAARPSMGKTSLALNIAENVALHHEGNRPVAVFSLEMSSEQLVRRMICCRARVSAHKLSEGFVSRELHGNLVGATDALMKAPIVIDDTAGLEVMELRSRARQLKRKHNIELIVVDYLQLLHYSEFAGEGRQIEVAKISSELKTMAKELQLPVLVLSQLSRAPEIRGKASVPKLSDLRDSGAIEQDADVVLLLRRPCKYPDDERSADKTLAVLDVAKNRNGPTGDFDLNFFDEFTRFESRDQRHRDEGGMT